MSSWKEALSDLINCQILLLQCLAFSCERKGEFDLRSTFTLVPFIRPFKCKVESKMSVCDDLA